MSVLTWKETAAMNCLRCSGMPVVLWRAIILLLIFLCLIKCVWVSLFYRSLSFFSFKTQVNLSGFLGTDLLSTLPSYSSIQRWQLAFGNHLALCSLGSSFPSHSSATVEEGGSQPQICRHQGILHLAESQRPLIGLVTTSWLFWVFLVPRFIHCLGDSLLLSFKYCPWVFVLLPYRCALIGTWENYAVIHPRLSHNTFYVKGLHSSGVLLDRR